MPAVEPQVAAGVSALETGADGERQRLGQRSLGHLVQPTEIEEAVGSDRDTQAFAGQAVKSSIGLQPC